MPLVDDFESFIATPSEQPTPASPPLQESIANAFETFKQTSSALKPSEAPTEAPSFGGYRSRAGVGRTPSPAPVTEPAPVASPFGVSSYRPKAPPLESQPPQKTSDKLALLETAKQKAAQAQIDKVEREKNEFSFKDLSEKPDLFKAINDYALARHGKDGAILPNETKEDYVKRWATEMRKIPSDSWEARTERLWLENAKQEDALKAVKAYDIWKNTASFYSPKGQEGFRPILDYLISGAGDPLNVLSVITGGVAGGVAKQVAKEGLKGTIKKKLVVGAPVVGVEAGSAAYSAIEEKQLELLGQKATNIDARSKIEQTKKIAALLPAQEQEEINNSIQQEEKRISESEKKVEEGVSVSDIALPTAVATLFGTAGTASLLSAKTKGLSLEEVLDTRRSLKQGEIRIEPKMDVSVPPPKVEITPKAATETQLEDAYDIFEGRKLLDKEGDPTAIAEMQIRNDVNKKAAQIAGNIWSQVPELAPKADQKVSDAVKNVFMNIDNIDDVVLRDALANAGVTPEEFARMNRTTAGDAGRTLQAYSVLARIQNKLKNIDPAAAKEVDLMYGKRNTLTSAFTGLYDLSLRLDRELKALMVSQVATTVRNAYSGLAVVTFGAASEAVESALYRMGKTAYELGSGKPLTGNFTGGLKGVYDDAVRTSFYLGQSNLSSDVAERLLAGSPTLRGRILRTVGENEATELSKVAQIANTLNVAQDAFFRKAIFTASVEKQLSRVGINMYDVIEQGKNIPIDVLKNATDEALAATFSKMPTQGIMFHGVKFIEALGPVGSTVIPFPRFMANAMSWTYKHSPMGIFSGAGDIAKGSAMLKAGNEEGQRYLMQGLENTSKGAIGTAAIYAAYKYRQENQDTNWYDVKNPDGSTVDARALFPAAPFLAMGDYLVKFEKARTDEFKTKEFLEAMTGFKVPAGTTSWLGDKFAESLSNMQTGEGSADTKVATFFGEWAGQYLGRALIPLQQVSDLLGAVDRDEALPRDAYQIPAGEEGFVSSAAAQLQKSVPILKQELPVYQPATRKETAFSDVGPLKMFTGIRVKVAPQPLEEEIIKLKIPNNKIFTTTGDKIVDASARKVMAPLVVDTFTLLEGTDFYRQASPDEKKIALQNLLAWAQKNAKEIASQTAMAEAFNKGEQARLFAVQYSKLPPEVKRATAEFYKRNIGKDLAETKDYMSALSIAAALKKQPEFAGGGLAKQMAETLIGKGTAKVATKSVIQSADELLQKATDMAAKAGVSIPPAAKQTEEVLPAAKQTENLLSQKGTEVVVPAEQQVAGVISKPAEAKPSVIDWSKYSEEQLQQAESLLKTSMGSQYQLDKFKASSSSDYQKSLLAKLQEIAPEGTATPPTPKDLSIVSPDIVFTPLNIRDKKRLAEIPDLGKLPMASNDTFKRKELLHNIRQLRQEAFPLLIDQLDQLSFTKGAKSLDDEVVAVAQGEYRAAKGREVDVNDAASVEDFASLASKLQNKLDDLRIKYKDTPPVVLYHGSRTERTKEKLARGFYDPQTNKKSHAELNAGAISFTKDPNLNYFVEKFGGKEPKNISQTVMPYAEYEFRRVNMTPDAYDKQDINYLARTITGSPSVARPLSIPRSQTFKETEDAFVEADKLKITQDVKAVTEKYGLIQKRTEAIDDAFNKLEAYDASSISTKQDPLASYEAYRNIRTLFKELRKQSDVTSTKTGYGQNYLIGLEKFGPALINIINDVQFAFKTQKAMKGSDKPSLLATFKDQLEILTSKKINPITGDLDMATVKEKTKAMNKIQQLTPKLNKGGALGLKKDSTQGGLAPYGVRHSGEGVKGKGYFGGLQTKEGNVATEMSSEFEYKGKNVEHPLIVPTLNKAELDHLLSGKQPTEAIYSKAQAFAKKRIDEGKGTFAEPTEIRYPVPEQRGLASRK
jgi:hypothetical protein